MQTMIEYIAKKHNLINSLRTINSAILSEVPILIGYTPYNLRYGKIAENSVRISGKIVKWYVKFASPETIEEELREHAASIGKEVKIKFVQVAEQKFQQGCYWWNEGKWYNKWEIKDYC